MASGTKQLSDMLKQLGWGSGFRLPIANEENMKLEQLLEAKQTHLVRLSSELQEVSLAVENSTSHLKHFQSKIQHAKDVENAKRTQVEKEKHFSALIDRDLAKTEQDVRVVEKHVRSLRDRNKILEGNVVRRKDILAELVDTINFDKNAISAYEDKYSKEDAYIKLIDDFAETDTERIKKCRNEYQSIGETIVISRRQLNATISETNIMDSELESLARRFRKAHSERNQFIENWKATLDALEARDQEIMDISHVYQKSAMEMKKLKAMLEKQGSFLENINATTKGYLSELSQLERKMYHGHAAKQNAQVTKHELAGSVVELTTSIRLMSKELRTIRKQMTLLAKDADGWEEKLKMANREVNRLKAKYDIVSLESLSSNEHVKQIDEFLDQEEQKAQIIMKELDKQIACKTQREQQMKELEENIVLSESQIRNLHTAMANARKEYKDKNDIVFKLHAVSYRLDLSIFDAEKKLRAIENPASLYSTDDYAAIQKELSKLQDDLQGLTKAQTLIKSQSLHCEHVTIICKKELEKETEHQQQYEIKLQKLNMQIRRIGREGDDALEAIKTDGVNNSLLQLQLRKLLDSVKDCEVKMYDLEQERVTLNTVVKARKKDIEVYTALLTNKKRGIQEETQKLKSSCYELSGEAQHKKRRYEMIMIQMWKGDDAKSSSDASDSNEHSEAYYIIKLAQEREYYRKEGDKWDERVKEAEKIVEGLQNTLSLMIGTNEVFKDSLKPATSNTEEGQKFEALKQQELELAYKLKQLKAKRSECYDLLQFKQIELDRFVSSKADLQQDLMEKQYELQGIIIEINGQSDKIRRATQQANKLVKELSKVESLDAELLQNDLRLRITKEKYEFAIATLERLLSAHPSLIGNTLEFLNEKGMKNLAERLTMKLISPSLAGSLSQSGRSTPNSSRSSGGRRMTGRTQSRYSIYKSSSLGSKSTVIDTKLGTSIPIDQLNQVSKMAVEVKPSRKSVIFESPTSTPAARTLLQNITKGLEVHSQKKSQVGETSHTDMRATVSAVPSTNKATATGVISFGALRKTLEEAVADADEKARPNLYKVAEEGQRGTETSQQADDFPTVEHESSVHEIIELVDKKHDFENED